VGVVVSAPGVGAPRPVRRPVKSGSSSSSSSSSFNVGGGNRGGHSSSSSSVGAGGDSSSSSSSSGVSGASVVAGAGQPIAWPTPSSSPAPPVGAPPPAPPAHGGHATVPTLGLGTAAHAGAIAKAKHLEARLAALLKKEGKVAASLERLANKAAH